MRNQKLQLTTELSNQHLTNLIKNIQATYNIHIQIVPEPCCNGSLDPYHYDPPRMTLGNKPIHPPISLFTNNKVSDIDFLQMTTSLFHELAHYHQNTYTYQKDTPSKDDVYMTIREIATRKNPFYYKPYDKHNYRYDPTEIMAEYQGLTQTYEYLQNEFEDIPSKTKEQIMVDFVNTCQNAPDYWIHSKKPFQFMEEIENAFEIAYEKSKFTKRKYFEYENQSQIPDENMRFMKQYPEMIETFEHARTGYQQDKIMACIACYLHPGFKDSYKSIQSVDLSPEIVLKMSLPEEPFFDYTYEIPQEKASKHDRAAELEAQYGDKFDAKPSELDTSLDYPLSTSFQ